MNIYINLINKIEWLLDLSSGKTVSQFGIKQN